MRSERGVALLLSLLTVLAIAVSTVGLARAVTHDRMDRRIDADERAAAELLRACARPIEHWLETRAGAVVLPPESVVPRVPVHGADFEADGRAVRVSIEAFDQAGMVPWAMAGSASPLRLLLPEEIRAAIDDLDHVDGVGVIPGLDLFAGRPFPDEESDVPPRLGGLVATHGKDPPLLNVHTAPLPLIERVYRLSGRGGVGVLETARSEGRRIAAVPPADEGRASRIAGALPRLSLGSPAWAFRIDLAVGRVHRAWWEVWSTDSEGWRCRQRLAIR
ncbi:MAG: hypothetical protein ACF8XB_11085 [Planctomycetota bacterium JB042]